MKFTSNLIFLGNQARESKKTGKGYYLTKLMDEETNAIYDMYVPSDRVQLVTSIAKATMFEKLYVAFEVNSFNGKAQVDLIGVKPMAKVEAK